MRIGGKIQELRKLSGMTQEQLAEKLNLSRQTISKWESDGTLPDLESVLKICRIFHISLDDLLEEERKTVNEDEKITLEDLAKINNRNKRNMLLIISSLLCFMIAIMILAVCYAVYSATVSTQYMLYRYIVAGQYANAPAGYGIPAALAAAAAVVGAVLLICCILENRKGEGK